VIDLHSHLLPAVDDGSRTVEQSVGVLRHMAERGITDVCLTPHLRANETVDAPPRRHDEAFAALRAQAPGLPRLHRGAEVMLDRPLPLEPDRMRRITLGGTHYILVEFPRLVAVDAVTNALTRVRDAGLTPVLAHPERYGCCTVEAVSYWRNLGARMQVDATTLHSPQTRGHGPASWWPPGWRISWRATITAMIARSPPGPTSSAPLDGYSQADLLTVANPGAILRDEPLTDVPPLAIRRTWMQRLRQLLSGEP
jgi:Capsular polysaccharide biosynthesis protein